MSDMSTFWQGWVIVLTVGNILFCFWLIWWTMRKRAGEAAQGDVTGHIWDGNLQEYNNPLPRWWLWLFYGTLVFGIAYYVLYPGLWDGLLGWTKEGQYETEVEAADAKYGPIYAQYRNVPVPALAKNEEAVGMGKRLFLTYCIQCHGSDAGGRPGYPNLTDNDWLWGGAPETIEATITNGRRAVMPAWEAVIGAEGVDKVAEYVQSLSGRKVDETLAAAGKEIFTTNCAACHMPDGTGMQALGAPNLTDTTWLYGGSEGTIKQTIRNGRNGHMPAHKELLGEDKIHLLTAYVYSLSN
jgi:cytochrome c oxidase cbb3-type subunit 3